MKVRLGILILLFSLVLFPVSVLAATWAKSHGGSNGDYPSSSGIFDLTPVNLNYIFERIENT